MNSQRRRLAADLARLRMAGIKTDCDGDLTRFYVTIRGPSDTPYSGKSLRLRVLIPPEYPYKSPSVAFVTRIWHPNVCPSSGAICLDVLNQTWTPLYGLANVFEQFVPQLLRYPNADDPLNAEAARQVKDDLKGFESYAKGYTCKASSSDTPSPVIIPSGVLTSGDDGPFISRPGDESAESMAPGSMDLTHSGLCLPQGKTADSLKDPHNVNKRSHDGVGGREHGSSDLSFSESLGDGEIEDPF